MSDAEQVNATEDEFVHEMAAPIYLKYQATAGEAATPVLNGLRAGKLMGLKCLSCNSVYIPARGSCPRCGVKPEGLVELPDRGTIAKFTVANIPIPNNPLKPPLVIAHIQLDGADSSFNHLIGEVDPADVHVGMRVKAVWKDAAEWGHTLGNISYFVPQTDNA
jgi:uncharacterized OB-fold protein